MIHSTRARDARVAHRYRWSLLALTCIVAIAVGVPVASADSSTEQGWWWTGRPVTGIPLLPIVAPEVPEGGLYVAGTATGPAGISAVRFSASVSRASKLVLVVGETTGTPAVVACLAAAPWIAAAGGAWDRRPSANCDSWRTLGRSNSDGTLLEFDMTSMPEASRVDLVLVPATDPFTAIMPTFSTTFQSFRLLPVGAQVRDEPAPVRERAGPSASPGEALSTPPESTLDVPGAQGVPPVSGVARQRDPYGLEAVADRLGFAYPSVLLLPLVFLVVGGALGWTLIHPVAGTPGVRRSV